MAEEQKKKDKDEKEQNKTSEQNKIFEESVDTNDLVWEMYKITYKDGILSECFNMETYETSDGRKYALLTVEGKEKIFGNIKIKDKDIKLSGDVIFNFSDTRCNGYENSIEEDYNVIRQIEYKEKLEECKKMHDSFENCALMISTGKLQQTKQHIGNDRGDVFVWALDEYYKGNNERVLEWAPKDKARILREFLNYFQDVYKYCEVFYNITDKGFIDRLIQSGSNALDSADKVENYIDLALKFWDERAEYMKKKYKEDRKKDKAIPQNESIFNSKSEYVINKFENNDKDIDITSIKTGVKEICNLVKINDIDEKILEENIKSCIINQTKETVEEYIDRVEGELEKKYNGKYEHSAVYKEKKIHDLMTNFRKKCENIFDNQIFKQINNNLPNLYKELQNKESENKSCVYNCVKKALADHANALSTNIKYPNLTFSRKAPNGDQL